MLIGFSDEHEQNISLDLSAQRMDSEAMTRSAASDTD